MCLLKYVLNCEENFQFFIFRSGLTVARLARVYICFCDSIILADTAVKGKVVTILN
jgi:hypothetical protein